MTEDDVGVAVAALFDFDALLHRHTIAHLRRACASHYTEREYWDQRMRVYEAGIVEHIVREEADDGEG